MSAEPTASKGASTNVAAPASSAAADVAAPASSVAAGQRGQQPATIRYVDRPDMEETFAEFGEWRHLRWAGAAYGIRHYALRRGQG